MSRRPQSCCAWSAWSLPALLLLALVAGSCACSSAQRHSEETTARSSPGSRLLSAPQIEDVDHPERPTLRLVRRRGDPQGAVAAAVYPTAGSVGSVALAALVDARMKAAGHQELEVSIHSLGVVFASEVSSPARAAQWLDDFRAALSAPVEEEAPVHRAKHMAAALVGASNPSPFGACLGQLTADGVPADWTYDEQQLEALRRQSVDAGRVGLAALGDEALLQAAVQTHEKEWPTGPPLVDTWQSEQIFARGTAPAPELRIALRVGQVDAALAGARALRKRSHPLRARLQALDQQLRIVGVDVALRPAGACVGLTLVHDRGQAPELSEMASAAVLASRELEQTVRQSRADDETTRALLAPEVAIEAAGLAAWTAIRAVGPEDDPTGIVIEYRAPPAVSASVDDWKQAVTQTAEEWEKRSIPVEVRNETGQAEAWLLVASPCGTIPETLEESGLRALTVHSLAADFGGRQGVHLEPWVSVGGIGLLAHSAARPGEDPKTHAARLARAVANALSGASLDGRDVAEQRTALLARVGGDQGQAFMTRLVSGGSPSVVAPHGSEASLATASTADVERARSELAREPLRAALLANAGPGQADAAQRALSQWLAPVRDQVVGCPEVHYEPTEPGTWTLETLDTGLISAHVGVWLPAPRELGRATEWLLNRPGGYLEHAIEGPGLATARGRWLGGERGGGLVVEVTAEPESLDAAVAQARGVLAALAAGGVSERDAERARRQQARSWRETLRSPRGRVVQLWSQHEPVWVSASLLRQFHEGLAAQRHLLLRVESRR